MADKTIWVNCEIHCWCMLEKKKKGKEWTYRSISTLMLQKDYFCIYVAKKIARLKTC